MRFLIRSLRALISLMLLMAGPCEGMAQSNVAARNAYKEAEAHFQAGRYPACLEALDRSDLALGRASEPSLLMRVRSLDKLLVQTPEDQRERNQVLELVNRCRAFLDDENHQVITYEAETRELEGLYGKWKPVLDQMPDLEALEEQRRRDQERAEAEKRQADARKQQAMLDLEEAIRTNDAARTLSLLTSLSSLTAPLPSGKPAMVACIQSDALDAFKAIEQYAATTDRGLNLSSDATRNYLLTEAIQNDAPGIATYLMSDRPAGRVRVEAASTDSPLEMAMATGTDRILLSMLQLDKALVSWEERIRRSPQLKSTYKNRLLNLAFQRKDAAVLQRVAELLGPEDDELPEIGFRCIREGTPEMLSAIMDQRPRRAKNDKGQSYLHEALERDLPEMALVLLKHGYRGEEPDAEGCPASHYLVTREVPNTLGHDSLLAAMDLNQADARGFYPIHKAVFRKPEKESVALLEAILAKNRSIDINVTSPFGWTALHYAAREGRADIARTLVAHQADRRAFDPTGRTPKDVAKEFGFTGVLSAVR